MFHGDNQSRFVPPEYFNLALLTLELEFVKRGAKDEQVWHSHVVLDALIALLIYTALIVESNLTHLVAWFLLGLDMNYSCRGYCAFCPRSN